MKDHATRRILIASAIGTTIEWYDLFVFATASALIFNRVFFPSFDPWVGTLLAFGTFASAYVARLLGAVVFGHFGDRIGRKSMLLISLGLMGVATFAIGLLPGYRSLGAWAPALLLSARLTQGFALGGEWGGAVLMAVEHAPDGRRGAYGSWVQIGVPLGTLIANLVFLGCAHTMSVADLLSWGWRVPFLLSALLVYVGYLIRKSVDETPQFAELRRRAAQLGLPGIEVFRHHWRAVLLGALLTMSGGVAFNLMVTFGLAYGTQTLGLSRVTMLTIALAACALCTVLVPLFGRLSDVVGRTSVLALGIVAEGMLAFPMFWLMDSRSPGFVLLAYLAMALAFAANYAPNATYLAECFKTSMRYSGLSITYMLAGLISSAASPFVTAELLKVTGKGASVAWYMVACSMVSLTALMLLGKPGDLGDHGRAAPVHS